MQISKPTFNQRANEIDGQRGALISPEQQRRIGSSLSQREARSIDHVAPISGKRKAVPSFFFSRAWFGVLAGDPPDADDPFPGSLHQNQAHLQKNFQFS